MKKFEDLVESFSNHNITLTKETFYEMHNFYKSFNRYKVSSGKDTLRYKHIMEVEAFLDGLLIGKGE